MNQDQVKQKLLELDGTVEEFTVTFTGKSSKKVDGLYKPDQREILLHNDNFDSDNALMYTALHEFAHHIHFTGPTPPRSARSHTPQFWSIFHNLLYKAEQKGIYTNVFEKDERFVALTKKIKNEYLSAHGHIMKEFGMLLVQAMDLCHETRTSFDDYVDRVLGFHRTEARTAMRISTMDLNPDIGYENMKTVSRIKDVALRRKAEEAFLGGKSPDMVRAQFVMPRKKEETIAQLQAEKNRLEKMLLTLNEKIALIELRIEELQENMVPSSCGLKE